MRGKRDEGKFGHGNAPKRAQMKEMLQPEHKKAPKRARMPVQRQVRAQKRHFSDEGKFGHRKDIFRARKAGRRQVRAQKRHFSCAKSGAKAVSGTEKTLFMHGRRG